MKILLLYDVDGWAWHIKSKAIKKYLPQYDIDIKKTHEFSKTDIKKYDSIHFFDWMATSLFKQVTTSITSHNHELLHWDIAKQTIPKFRGISCISKELYNRLQEQKLNTNLYLCQNGVDETIFYPDHKRNKDKFVIGWVGQKTMGDFVINKRIDIKGYQHVFQPLKEKLKEYTDIEVVEHSDTYKTGIPHTEMIKIYNSLDILISTSYLEGTPACAFEAAACGIPVISTAVGCVPELIENFKNGILIDPYKNLDDITSIIDTFVSKILFLKNNREICRIMGEENRKEVESKWTWREKAKNWIPVFEENKNTHD